MSDNQRLAVLLAVARRRCALAVVLVGTVTCVPGAALAQEVKVPLDDYERAQKRLVELQKAEARAQIERPVVVGETRYRGRSDGRSLRLTLTARVQLASSNAWKSVPVIGIDAVIVGASIKGEPVPLVAQGPYWVWNTRDQGTIDMVVDVVVAPRGPRGSLEYAFHTVESPVTDVTCFFPAADLDPQVSGALSNDITPNHGGITLHATLRSTTEIHVVGFHDVDQGDGGAQAKLYGETESLVSLTDDTVDVFAVVKLTILYASQKRFRIELPAGYDVVSADGEGAFQYTMEGSVLVGETAFPIKQRYEISLRLKRALSATEQSMTLPVLKLKDVERDTGFVAVEIPGKLSIAGATGAGLLPIDARELPPSLVESSVSPIVKAFRYAGQREEAKLQLARYPEKALAPGGVDKLRATSVVTEDGRVMTDVAFTIRNNVQQYLALALPDGALVRSAVLEGNPIKPSKDDAGRVLIPLMRSKRGSGTLKPFRVQLVYESELQALGSFGSRSLTLPRLEVPVSSLSWGVYVPARYLTTGLLGAVHPEEFVRNASFAQGRSLDEGIDDGEAGTGNEETAGATRQDLGFLGDLEGDAAATPTPAPTPAARTQESTGAMPVRVQMPTTGVRLVTTRYWLDPNEPLTVSFRYARIPLVLVCEAALALLCVVAAAGLSRRTLTRHSRIALWMLGLGCAALIGAKFHTATLVATALLCVVVVLWRRGAWREVVVGLADVVKLNLDVVTVKLRGAREKEAAAFATRRHKGLLFAVAVPALEVAWMMIKLLAVFIAASELLAQLADLVKLLWHPL